MKKIQNIWTPTSLKDATIIALENNPLAAKFVATTIYNILLRALPQRTVNIGYTYVKATDRRGKPVHEVITPLLCIEKTLLTLSGFNLGEPVFRIFSGVKIEEKEALARIGRFTQFRGRNGLYSKGISVPGLKISFNKLRFDGEQIINGRKRFMPAFAVEETEIIKTLLEDIVARALPEPTEYELAAIETQYLKFEAMIKKAGFKHY